jgi:Lon protease-like protein
MKRYHRGMATGIQGPRLPLFPLAGVVHFPHTQLKIHVAEPACRRLVQDVVEQDEDGRLVGVVLLKPGFARDQHGRPEVFAGGTAGRLLDAELLPDGCSNIVLHGEYRFQLRCEVGQLPYRQAVVDPVEEPWVNERDPGIVAVRSGLLDLLHQLTSELGDRCPWDPDQITAVDHFEELVNRIAADLDTPALRKQQLLQESLLDRALSVLSILRSRRLVIERLRPFRHLATDKRLN